MNEVNQHQHYHHHEDRLGRFLSRLGWGVFLIWAAWVFTVMLINWPGWVILAIFVTWLFLALFPQRSRKRGRHE